MSIGKRLTSFMLSAVMIAGNMVSPITAYAGETEAGNTSQVQSESAAETTAGQETAATTEVQPAAEMPVSETEAKKYRLTLPAGDGYSFTYDQNHFSEEDKEKKNVTLLYKAGDEVDLDLLIVSIVLCKLRNRFLVQCIPSTSGCCVSQPGLTVKGAEHRFAA